jgi:hypothetical protein
MKSEKMNSYMALEKGAKGSKVKKMAAKKTAKKMVMKKMGKKK